MTIDDILSRLDGVKPGSGKNQYIAKCPAHHDQTQSLSVGVGEDGRILLNCFAGCETSEIVGAIGLEMKELFIDQPKVDKPPIYFYTDKDGNIIAKKERWEGDRKGFTWYRPLGCDWLKGLGKDADKVEISLYKLDSIAKSSIETPVYLVEGEKDVDTLTSHGLIATTTPNGAATKWSDPLYTDPLKNRIVYIIPDNDDSGKKYSNSAAAELSMVAKSVKILDLKNIWPVMPEKADITDYVNEVGWTKASAGLDELINSDPVENIEEDDADEDWKFFLIPKNKKYPYGEKKVHVGSLVIYLRRKHKIKLYTGQFRILKSNYYQHIENMRALISSEIPNYYRLPKDIEDCEKLLYYEQDMILKDEDLAPEKYIAFKNGILDVETMQFIDYCDPKAEGLVFIHQVDYNWNPMVKNDQKTDDFFNVITGGEQQATDFLYQVLGVLMSNYRDFKQVFYFTGVKDSGKSQFLHLCESLLTDSDGARDFSNIGLKALTDENSKELVGIIGKRANICGETPPLNIKNDTLIKQLSGGDFVTLYRKFLGALTFKNKAMMVFAGNTVPNFFVSDKSSIGERLLIYRFKTATPKEKQIPNVYKTLNMEYIIVKAVEQLLVFVENKQQFDIPPEIHENRELMERESDSIYRFFKECVVYTDNKDHRINSPDLFTAYQYYLMDEGSIPKEPYIKGDQPDGRYVKISQRSFIGKIKPMIGDKYHDRNITYYDGKTGDCFTGIQLQNVHVNWGDQEYKIKLLK